MAIPSGNVKLLLEESRRTLAARFPLPWSHYVKLLTLKDKSARLFYEDEALRAPLVLEFLNLRDEYSEADLETFLLKLGTLDHADAGQRHHHLSYAREHWTHEGENPPVGIILCFWAKE